MEEKNFNDIIRLANHVHDMIQPWDPKILRLKQGEEAIRGTEKNYSWLLEHNESLDDVTFYNYYEYQDIYKILIDIKTHIDPQYLCKWKNLSYCDATWEPLKSL